MKISGYTQAYNLKSQHYPWKESIESLIGFCDEVIIVDGGSTDGTYEELLNLQKLNNKIKLFINKVDWNAKGASIHDGLQKAFSRSKCSGDWCFQLDVDEIIHENYYESIINIAKSCPINIDLLSFPFVEFWGLNGKIRGDFLPIKNRMSRNKDYITHGIPSNQRSYAKDGRLISTGSDGCCYINKDNYDLIKSAVIFDANYMNSLRSDFIYNKSNSYQDYYLKVIEKIPTIFHYSWANLYKKIKAYRQFWQKHWNDLYDKNIEDTAENNMFFDKPWSEVKDEEIKELAIKLENEMCGWIFHSKIDFSKPFPNLFFNGSHPKVMQDWIKLNAIN